MSKYDQVKENERKIVITGSHQQFRDFLEPIEPERRGVYVYAENPIKLKGVIADEIIYYGAYGERKDLAEIKREAEARIK